MRQPTIYLPHGGGPCFFMEWSPRGEWDRMADWLRSIPSLLPETPRALLVISAHWEESTPTVMSSAAPPLFYDYYGFPPETYQLKWPAKGEPELAARVKSLVGASANETRGFDHGVFIPLKLSWPEAEIPTVQLSLQAGLDPSVHLELGRKLAPLRDEGVLILGSGMSYHNMRGFGAAGSRAHSQKFDEWLAQTVAAPSTDRARALAEWSHAPSAKECHPREEHLIPLMVAAGAAGVDAGKRVFRDEVLGVVVSAVQFG